MARTESGVAGEWQFSTRAENPHCVARGQVARRDDKDRLRQVRPVREGLHLFGPESRPIKNYSYWITKSWLGGEDVNLRKRSLRMHELTLADRSRSRHRRELGLVAV